MLDKLVNLQIGSKLMLAFCLLILGFGGVQFVTLERFSNQQKADALLFQRTYARVSDIKEVLTNILRQRADLLLVISQTESDQRQAYLDAVEKNSRRNDLLLQQLHASLGDDAEMSAILSELQQVRADFVQTRDTRIAPLIQEGRIDEARSLAVGVQAQRMERMNTLGEQLVELSGQRVAESVVRSQQNLAAQREFALLLGLVLVGLSVLLAWLFSRHIAHPLARLTDWAEQISAGEIPRDIRDETRRDEVGRLSLAFTRMGHYLLGLAAKAESLAQGQLHEDIQPVTERDVLGRAFTAMVRNLRNLVGELHEGISVLASASEEILAVTTQVASSTQETATAISEIATTVEEVKQAAVLSGNQSQAVSESTERTRQVAQSGLQAVEQNLQGMGQIREQMQAVAESIMRLGEQSQMIGEIVASVNDLAEQSNLLGVNASIEAVKAGEAGKGFSVVAQEVKTLAEQSKQATAQVRGILGDIQKAMTRAVMLAEEGSKAVEGGYQRAQSSGEAIRTLGGSVEESSEVAMQIAASSQQQMIGMEQIGGAMESIRQASQDNVAGARQVDLAARNLHELGVKLKGLAAQFKL
ncbi:HAMP domain-containing methyl-accepting chemotaxis protein [Pseudomonas sp. CAU 1711]|uniref:methyl-accepting chemotaxis protein n=1 Tax=Pseudomonas sp. CAU 1711 TaxID=3140356 RepID=UPI00325FFF85